MIDLMKPRYKVIADHPTHGQPVGSLLRPTGHGTFCLSIGGHSPYEMGMPESLINKYPLIFKRLQWWEEREEGEMPEFVKCIDGSFFPVHKYNIRPKLPEVMIKMPGNIGPWEYEIIPLTDCTPATEQDYLTYLQSSRKQPDEYRSDIPSPGYGC